MKVCNFLVVSDELWHEGQPAFGTKKLRDAMRRAKRVILCCLAKDLTQQGVEHKRFSVPSPYSVFQVRRLGLS